MLINMCNFQIIFWYYDAYSTHYMRRCIVVCLAAAKQNFSTKDCTKEKLEVELKSWFDNARDRGEGGRKKKQQNAPPGPVAVNNNVVNALPIAVNNVNALPVTTEAVGINSIVLRVDASDATTSAVNLGM